MKTFSSFACLGIFLAVCFGLPLSGIYANTSVVVSATVGNIKPPPVVISVDPNSDPKLLGTSEVQRFSLYYQDADRDPVTFTVTPQDGFVAPLSGHVSKNTYDSSSGAYIHFTYRAPDRAVGTSEVTVTLNDGSNVTTKVIGLYIY